MILMHLRYIGTSHRDYTASHCVAGPYDLDICPYCRPLMHTYYVGIMILLPNALKKSSYGVNTCTKEFNGVQY